MRSAAGFQLMILPLHVPGDNGQGGGLHQGPQPVVGFLQGLAARLLAVISRAMVEKNSTLPAAPLWAMTTWEVGISCPLRLGNVVSPLQTSWCMGLDVALL